MGPTTVTSFPVQPDRDLVEFIADFGLRWPLYESPVEVGQPIKIDWFRVALNVECSNYTYVWVSPL